MSIANWRCLVKVTVSLLFTCSIYKRVFRIVISLAARRLFPFLDEFLSFSSSPSPSPFPLFHSSFLPSTFSDFSGQNFLTFLLCLNRKNERQGEKKTFFFLPPSLFKFSFVKRILKFGLWNNTFLGKTVNIKSSTKPKDNEKKVREREKRRKKRKRGREKDVSWNNLKKFELFHSRIFATK